MKAIKLIKNIITGIILICYFSVIIFVSALLLNRNDYGMTQFKDDTWILVDGEISNSNYPKGSLVIVENKKIEELQVGEEIFVYKTNEKEKTVEIIVAKIESVNPQTEDNSAYITLENNGGSWGEDYIAGVSKKIYPNIGSILSFLESKWIFFIFLIVPCFFILIYEIYLAIIEIKYGDEEEEDKEVNTKESDTIEDLKKQLEMLKQEVTAQKESIATADSKVISDTPEKEITVEKKETKDELEDTIELL